MAARHFLIMRHSTRSINELVHTVIMTIIDLAQQSLLYNGHSLMTSD